MEINYESINQVGHLSFTVYNGAMDLYHCEKLLEAYQTAASSKEDKVLVLWGGTEFFSNGIDLSAIHHRYNPAILAYKNLKALNEVIRAILETKDKFVIAALQGSAAAGGVMLALAADLRYGRDGIVLNPSYVNMGLSGAEYWSVLLPSMIGYGRTQKLIYEAEPLSCEQAVQWGLIHAQLSREIHIFQKEVAQKAEYFASHNIETRLAAKSVLNHRMLKEMEEQIRLEMTAMKECCNHAEFAQSRSHFISKHKNNPYPQH
ncbi:enoyl-CoA hydratase/isomerase family protein [Deltaproteobacteria bacterium TL4]